MEGLEEGLGAFYVSVGDEEDDVFTPKAELCALAIALHQLTPVYAAIKARRRRTSEVLCQRQRSRHPSHIDTSLRSLLSSLSFLPNQSSILFLFFPFTCYSRLV